jgi:hypothetical protein
MTSWFVCVRSHGEQRRLGPYSVPVLRLGGSRRDGRLELPGVESPWVELLLMGGRWHAIDESSHETTLQRASGEVVELRDRVALDPGDRLVIPGGPEVWLEPDDTPGVNDIRAQLRAKTRALEDDVVVAPAHEPEFMAVYGLPPVQADLLAEQRRREADEARRRMSKFDVELRTSEGVRHKLVRVATYIGVGPDCDVRVTWRARVSRPDGALICVREKSGTLWIEDLSGTLTRDGAPVEWEPLEVGATYQLGALTLVFA